MLLLSNYTVADSISDKVPDKVSKEVGSKEDILTGDTKLACEAVLCLSSSERPSECEPSLRRYFGIHFKHGKDTAKARHDFLKQCPLGDDKGSQK